MKDCLFTAEDINLIFNAHLNSKLKFKNVALDSREIKDHGIFIAFKGKKNDGHNFVQKITNKKNNLAIVSKNAINKKNIIKVKNTLEGLRNLADYSRQRSKTTIIAITGSCGKTSLKNLLSHTLKKFGSTYAPPKSFNNHIGVPYALANLSLKNKYGVFEVGMSSKGEIDKLASMIKPDIGIITNIGPAHLENFKNLLGICKAKSELIDSIEKGGYIILNRDDNFFNFLKNKAKKNNVNVISFGFLKADLQIKNSVKKFNNKLLIKVNNKVLKFNIKKNNKIYLYNIAATIAVHFCLGHSLYRCRNIFQNIKPTEGRGNEKLIKIFNKNIFLVNDSYNSNPLSLTEAIHNFDLRKVNAKERKIILIGDMLELGKKTKFYHEKIAFLVNKTNIDKVCCVGPNMLDAYNKLIEAKRGFFIKNVKYLEEELSKILKNNDILLVKSSNKIGLFNFFKKF